MIFTICILIINKYFVEYINNSSNNKDEFRAKIDVIFMLLFIFLKIRFYNYIINYIIKSFNIINTYSLKHTPPIFSKLFTLLQLLTLSTISLY